MQVYVPKSSGTTVINQILGNKNVIFGLTMQHVVNFDWLFSFESAVVDGVEIDGFSETLTIPSADANDRFDVPVLQSDGTMFIVGGTADASNPAIPVITDLQVKMTVILVEGGTTTPSYITETLVYDEGAGVPTEFDATKNDASITLDYVGNPKEGTKSIFVNGSVKNKSFSLQFSSLLTASDFETLILPILFGNAVNHRMIVYLFNSVDGVYNSSVGIKNAKYGMVGNQNSTYQSLAIPFADFGLGNLQFDTIEVYFQNDGSILNFDDIKLQGGFTESLGNHTKLSDKINDGETGDSRFVELKESDRVAVGSSEIDWGIGGTFIKTITGAETFTDANLPQGENTQTITLILTGDFAVTFPAYYVNVGGMYDGTVDNVLVIECINGNSGSEVVYYSINTEL